MITIEAIKTMFKSSTTLQDYEDVYEILKERKAEINRAYYAITQKIADKTAHIPLDINRLKDYVNSIDDNERKLLEEYASTQIQFRKVLIEIEALLKDTHLKIRGFYL